MTLQAIAQAAEPSLPPTETTIDALDLLCREHEHAQALAEECRRHARSVSPDPQVRERAERLCLLLRRLSEIEEGLFYPVARAALESPQLVDLAALEHATARQIIRQLQSTDSAEPRYEALLLALSDCVERHVKHEQGELFPRLRLAALDWCALGERMRRRRPELRDSVTH
jgi:hemerythrin-like domain-containing protein